MSEHLPELHHRRRNASGRPVNLPIFVDTSGKRRRLWTAVGVAIGCAQLVSLVALGNAFAMGSQPAPTSFASDTSGHVGTVGLLQGAP